MKYLDQRIEIRTIIASGTEPLPQSGIYTYTLKARPESAEGSDKIIFVGNFYYKNGTSVYLDVTDIIRNNENTKNDIAPILHSNNQNEFEEYFGASIKEYYIILSLVINGETVTKESFHELVALVYRYPNRSKYVNMNGNDVFLAYNLTTFGPRYELLLQGTKYQSDRKGEWDKYILVPRYPLKATNNYTFAATFGYGSDVTSIPIEEIGGDGNYVVSTTLNLDWGYLYNTTWTCGLSELLEDYIYEIEEHGMVESNLELYYTSNSNQTFLMAIFEACKSRYYLQWVDRFGSIQSQPFKENSTYSEDFNNENIINYADEKRVSHITINPKWKLYSGWINERVYPIYESLFVSPFIILYDTETNMNYKVLIKGNYIEKNHKNQKGLLNLELELEASEPQNITY